MSFDKSTIELKVKEVVSSQLNLNIEDLQASTEFSDHADSLDMVELVMALEEEFGIEVPDEEAETLQTVEKTVNWIFDKAA